MREAEKLQLLAQLAVVAFLGLLHHRQILVEHRLLGEGDAVNAGEHLVLLVAAPVGSGDRGELDGLDQPRVGQVRSPAEVGECAVGVERDRAVFQVADQLHFVRIALFGEILQRVGFRYFRADELLLVARKFDHLLLDGFQIGFGDGHG